MVKRIESEGHPRVVEASQAGPRCRLALITYQAKIKTYWFNMLFASSGDHLPATLNTNPTPTGKDFTGTAGCFKWPNQMGSGLVHCDASGRGIV